MKAVIDVYYSDEGAAAACLSFQDWRDSAPLEAVRAVVPIAARYRPGRFFERELPPILEVLRRAGRDFETIVIDGYVHLKPGCGKGLGIHLHQALPSRPAVVGVAKNPLRIADRFLPVYRGRSRKPLYVSAVGFPLHEAALAVSNMHGPFRIPMLLRLADRYARETVLPES